MSIKETIQNDIKEALKNHDEVRVLVLRGVASAFNNKEIEKRTRLHRDSGGQAKLEESETVKELEQKSKLTEEEAVDVIFNEVKKRREAIVEYEKGKREDLVQKEKAELDILQKYLPEQLSEDEIKKLAQEAIVKTGAAGMKDMGKVLGILMSRIKGKAEGGLVSQIVKDLLNG